MSIKEEHPEPITESGSPRLAVYRDPNDVRTIFQLLSALMVVLVLFVASAAGNAWQYWRRPDRIVVDRSSGRVLLINDRQTDRISDRRN